MGLSSMRGIGRKSVYVFLIVAALLGIIACQEIEIIPQVETQEGIVRGFPERSRNNREYVSFKGIPYAKKPERFKLSQPPESWDGVRKATAEGNPCPQMYLRDGAIVGPFGSEDCLFINVYTPHKNEDKNYPVMIWIHGGAFVVGSSNDYRPDYFMDEDVVLVTFNYRLGVFGFIYNEDDTIPGNLGLKDQVEALKWVKRNIQNFGGDVKNVTIFGESGGAVSVHLHMLSELSKGIFHRAIAQSGNALAPWGLNRYPKWHAARFAMKLGCPPSPTSKMVECLTNLDAQTLVEAQLQKPLHSLWGFHWAPVVEVDRGVNESTAFITQHPLELIENQNFTSKVPLLTGIVKNEASDIVSTLVLPNRELMYQMNTNWSHVSPRMLFYDDRLLKRPMEEIASEKIREFYFGHNSIGFETRQSLMDLISDRYYNHPTFVGAKINSAVAPTYAYLITFNDELIHPPLLRDLQSDFNAPAHIDEIPYLFKQSVRPCRSAKRQTTFSKNLVKLWATFAATGKPDKLWGKANSWPQVKTSDSIFMWYKLDQDTQLLQDPFHWRMRFWDHLLATELKGMAR